MKIFSWAISITLLTDKIELVTVVELLYIRQLVLFINGDLILRYSGTNVFGWKSNYLIGVFYSPKPCDVQFLTTLILM